MGHNGPAGSWPILHLDATLDDYLPMGIVAFGDNTLELAGRCFDEVVLHTFFTDETTAHCVQTVKRAAEKAGRNPDDVKVWSCYATIGDHIGEEERLMKLVGRLGTYLQGYGHLLARTNGWDEAVVDRFLADEVVSSVRGLDVVGTTEQLQHAATLIPDDWLSWAAVGSPADCVAAVRNQLALGCDGVIDAAGASATLKIALDIVRPAGWVSKVGWGPQPLGFNLDPLVQKNITLQGSFSHNWPIWERVIALMASGQFDVRPIIGGVWPITDWHTAFEKML
jgi:hypothetical protein